MTLQLTTLYNTVKYFSEPILSQIIWASNPASLLCAFVPVQVQVGVWLRADGLFTSPAGQTYVYVCVCVRVFLSPSLHYTMLLFVLHYIGLALAFLEHRPVPRQPVSQHCVKPQSHGLKNTCGLSIRLSPFMIYSSTQNCLTTISARVHGYSVTQPPPLIPRQNKLSVDKVLDLILLPRVQQALVLELSHGTLKSTDPLFDNKSH